ncbi:MAG TPA: RES family NAD+ phosphorylase [Oligoflexus sp.]|uniref:RES family NAD+ phosphorylase n=1 Tax=Oligoflexus sp. TaxID=1971216 RepID=UPI002D511BD5|nr:RES family NAD+ phosphorylase [Oligoflexus sp.]HYX38267.1 RES family NAD+ phosphorylase [Oligoflexus sp.]
MEPSELLDQCPLGTYDGPCFRAIYTSFPSRNLYSDIGFREGDPDFEIAMHLADSDASIDFSQPQQLRPFQYSDLDNFLRTYTSEVIPRENLLFPLINMQKGRFSDGTFGVFYAAAEEATSLAEVAFHFIEDCQYEIKMSPQIFRSWDIDKRIIQIEIVESGIYDFRPFAGQVPELTADALEYCQALGILLKKRKIPLALTPSARVERGTCIPIFSESAIPKGQVRTIHYYHFKFDRATGLKVKKSDVHQTDWTIPADWKLPLNE